MTFAVSFPPAADVPETLARFRTYGARQDESDKKAVYDSLRGDLLFKAGSTFNDPFEGKPHHVAAFSDAKKQEVALRNYMLQYAREFGIADAEAIVEQRFRTNTIQEITEQCVQRAGQYKTDETLLLCLAHPDVISTPLLWSHYANSHRGVCIEFDTSFAPVHFAQPVRYDEDYPTLLIPRTAESDPSATLFKTFFTKAKDWKYEHEYRVALFRDPTAGIAAHLYVEWTGDIAHATSAAVKRVTLGAAMPPALRNELVGWVKATVPHVEVWQASLHPSRYEIVRTRVWP